MRGFREFVWPREIFDFPHAAAARGTHFCDHREHPAVIGFQEGTGQVFPFSLRSTQHRAWHTTGLVHFLSSRLGPASPAKANTYWARLCPTSLPPVRGGVFILPLYRWRNSSTRRLITCPRSHMVAPWTQVSLNPESPAATQACVLLVWLTWHSITHYCNTFQLISDNNNYHFNEYQRGARGCAGAWRILWHLVFRQERGREHRHSQMGKNWSSKTFKQLVPSHPGGEWQSQFLNTAPPVSEAMGHIPNIFGCDRHIFLERCFNPHNWGKGNVK